VASRCPRSIRVNIAFIFLLFPILVHNSILSTASQMLLRYGRTHANWIAIFIVTFILRIRSLCLIWAAYHYRTLNSNYCNFGQNLDGKDENNATLFPAYLDAYLYNAVSFYHGIRNCVTINIKLRFMTHYSKQLNAIELRGVVKLTSFLTLTITLQVSITSFW